MSKKEFYRFLSHITAGSVRKKYRQKYKSILSERDLLHKIITDLSQQNSAQKSELDKLQTKVNDIEFRQCLFFDYFLDPAQARPATGMLLVRQNENMTLLKEAVRICRKYDIPYWLDFGTLLGCARHTAPVPWDDDIDIALLKDDLVRFRDAFEQEQSKQFAFLFWDGRQSRLIFKQDTGAFLDLYAYNTDGEYIKPEPVFPIASYNRSIPRSVVFPLGVKSFCGLKVHVPCDIDAYLTVRYGNWHLLPKRAHTVGGHNCINEFKIFKENEK